MKFWGPISQLRTLSADIPASQKGVYLFYNPPINFHTLQNAWLTVLLGYLFLDIICSSKLTVFLELRSRKTVRFSEQIMPAEKYPSIFLRQMETIVYIIQVLHGSSKKYQLITKSFNCSKSNLVACLRLVLNQ